MAEKDPTELIHAKYVGETDIVMPVLGERDRCCRKENDREGQTGPVDKEGKPDPEGETPKGEEALPPGIERRALVRKGDVILLDRWSAEGRDDFTPLEEEPSAVPEPAARRKPQAEKGDE